MVQCNIQDMLFLFFFLSVLFMLSTVLVFKNCLHRNALSFFLSYCLLYGCRVENRSAVLPIRFRQADSGDDSWQLLSPGSAASFAWENVLLDHLLEILVDGQDPLRSVKYNIDEPTAYRPMPSFKGPAVALQTIIFKEGMFNVFRVVDWKPSNDNLSIVSIGAPNTPQTPTPESGSLENQFHTVIELDEFGLSIIDHTPEELLYVSIQNLVFNYATGLGSGTSRLKLRMDNFQVDCQIPLTPTPVLFIAQESEHRDFLLKCTITMQDNGVPDYFSYPYISIQGPNVPNVSFLVNIHEPIIWRLHEMFHRLSLGRLRSSQTTAVAIDPNICIG
jgi:vacuolar protein sorting-associated protein 13A/C